jgi:hypothetical protein
MWARKGVKTRIDEDRMRDRVGEDIQANAL